MFFASSSASGQLCELQRYVERTRSHELCRSERTSECRNHLAMPVASRHGHGAVAFSSLSVSIVAVVRATSSAFDRRVALLLRYTRGRRRASMPPKTAVAALPPEGRAQALTTSGSRLQALSQMKRPTIPRAPPQPLLLGAGGCYTSMPPDLLPTPSASARGSPHGSSSYRHAPALLDLRPRELRLDRRRHG